VTGRSPSDQPALFVEREYNSTWGFAKAARQSAATRAANSQGVSGIHSDVPITCSFTAEVVNGLSTDCHFSVSTEHAPRRSMEQAAECQASSERPADVVTDAEEHGLRSPALLDDKRPTLVIDAT
jgi:hypothetical protein